jgi:hypothetical protein
MKTENVVMVLVYICSLLSLDIYYFLSKEDFIKSDVILFSYIFTNVVVSLVIFVEVTTLIISKRNNIKK